MKNAILLALISLTAIAFICRATVGDAFVAVMTDTSGNIVSTPLTLSNQVNMTVVATNGGQLIRYANYTNSSISILTSGQLPIANGGTGTNQTRLVGSWTNTLTFVSSNMSLTVALPVSSGGIGTNANVLTGTWTNSVNFQVNGTNNAARYQVGGILGFSGSVTNTVGSLTNINVYGSGILTNVVRL